MSVSRKSLEGCSDLFDGFSRDISEVLTFRSELFEAVSAQVSLYSETLRVLTNYQSDRCRAVYLLTVNGLVWDAEIVLRSFYETSAKVYFLSTSPIERREQLLSEFWEILPAIYDPKDGDRAQVAEKLAKRFERSDDVRIFSYLRDPNLFNLDRIKNRSFRNEVEQRWSFSKIMETLAHGSDGHARISSIDTLLYGYGMASHLAHANPKAFDLLEDRAIRGGDLKSLEMAHIARILSDMLSLTVFGLHQAQMALLGTMPMAQALKKIFERSHARSEEVREAFHRAQDDFYNKN